MKFRVLSIFIAVCFIGGLLILGLFFKQQQQLVAFQERLHMVERSLAVYKQIHGRYPDSLTELNGEGFFPVLALASATYNYRANVDEILLDGRFQGHFFEIRTKTGMSFK